MSSTGAEDPSAVLYKHFLVVLASCFFTFFFFFPIQKICFKVLATSEEKFRGRELSARNFFLVPNENFFSTWRGKNVN